MEKIKQYVTKLLIICIIIAGVIFIPAGFIANFLDCGSGRNSILPMVQDVTCVYKTFFGSK